MCVHYESKHEGHSVKPIPIAIELANKELGELVAEAQDVCKMLNRSIMQFQVSISSQLKNMIF